jgi:formate/nitrite transporter FocA (FNT family)
MKTVKILVSAILAGFCIGLGGMLFLAMDDKVIGASLFSTGLFIICTKGYHLFTGKVCYAFQNDFSYALTLPVIWIGNLIGTGGVALILRLSRARGLAEKAASICQVKQDDSLLSLFLLGVLCNIFIFIAVDGYKNNQHEIAKYAAIFLGVVGFILCGAEHCVADMFYYHAAMAWNGDMILRMLVITAGNAAGGILAERIRSFVTAA